MKSAPTRSFAPIGASVGPDDLLVAVAATTFLYIFTRVQWRIGDEGDMLNGALAVAQGAVPYRDFLDLRGPASFYWLGFFFKIFGATWLVARVHLLMTGAISGLLVYRLTKRVCHGLDAYLPCALVTVLSIPMWAASHHHWDSNLFALAATAAFFQWQDSAQPRWLIASGVLAGLTSCFIYQKGFYLLASFLVILVMSRLVFRTPAKAVRGAAILLLGYGAVGLTVLAWFFHLGALHDFVDATIRSPLTTYGDANRLPYAYHLTQHAIFGLGASNSLPPVAAAIVLMIPFLLIAGLPFLVAVLLAAYAMTRPDGNRFALPIASYCLIGFALWFSEFHRRDMMHLIYGCPVLLVALWLLWDRLAPPRPVNALVRAIVVASVLFVATFHGVRAAAAGQRMMTRRGPIVLPADDPALRFLLSAEVKRGDYVFVYPYYSTYYFLANVRNPTRFGELMYGPGAKPFFDEAIAAIESRRVTYILWDTLVAGDNLKEWFPAYQPPPEGDLSMEQYFASHYEQQAVLNGFRLLKRRR